MLVESSFSSPVETSLLNVSEFQNPFAEYDWASLAETYQMIHKIPDKCQVSFPPVPNAMNLEEPKLQVSCPEQSVKLKVSKKDLTSLVYSRRKRSVKPTEHSSGKSKKQDDSLDDSIVHGESSKRKNRFDNCLFYSRRRRKSSCSLTGETTSRGDDDVFVSEHDCGETKRRDNRLDNCLVYTRKKGGIKIRGDHAESSSHSQRRQIDKADGGDIKNSGDQPVHSQNKQLVKSNGSHIGETKRNGDRSNELLWYSRRKKQRGKSIVTSADLRVNGFLVYRRRKHSVKTRGTFTRIDLKATKKNGDQPSVINSHTADGISHVEQDSSEVTCSSDETNDKCSSLKSSSEIASGSGTTEEDEEATDGDSSDDRMSETDTEGSSSPFRKCKHCEKPGTIGKMLFCNKCKESYHTRCYGIRMKNVAEINDWLCPSCWRKKSSKSKSKGKTSWTTKLRVKPSVIGIRIGKEFQADVPDWSGPTMSDTSFLGEPLEIDPSEYTHDLKKAKKGKKHCRTVNWLQCREEDANGDICGKWRRAPRSEVQTKDWECFCCVLWDPSHADCAVPQELETSEILKQLKYVKMLRPRSDAKRRKLGQKGQSRSNNKGKD